MGRRGLRVVKTTSSFEKILFLCYFKLGNLSVVNRPGGNRSNAVQGSQHTDQFTVPN